MAKNQPKSDPKAEKPDESQPEDGGNVQTKAEQLPEATETVRVKFLRSHPALAYHPGEEADLPQDLYDRYLEDGPFFKQI